MSEQDTSTVSEDRKAEARRYDQAHNRLFLIRICVTLLLVLAYLFLGASQHLAVGLQAWFSKWWAINIVYLFVTMLGYSAFMFPLSLYTDYELERAYGKTEQSFGEWTGDYLRSLVLELLLATFFFGVVYALLHGVPEYWWIYAAFTYTLFVLFLTNFAPFVMGLFAQAYEPLENKALQEKLSFFAGKGGLEIHGIYQWGFDDPELPTNAVLMGMGKTRRIILHGDMLNSYSDDEMSAILAHEVAHHVHKDMMRHVFVGLIMSMIGFFLANQCMIRAIPRLGFSSISDIGGFPVFVLILFVFSIVIMPLINAYSRKREMAADTWAVRMLGKSAPMISALEKMADDNLAEHDPARWVELLFHSHPSIKRRIAHAQKIEQELTNHE